MQGKTNSKELMSALQTAAAALSTAGREGTPQHVRLILKDNTLTIISSLPYVGTRSVLSAECEVSGEAINEFKTKMETPMVTVAQVYNVDVPYSEQAEVSYEALSYILNMIYTETLREEEGGTYGASAYSNVMREPHENAALQIVFQTNVEQADALRELARSEFEEVAQDGPSAEMFDKAKKNLEKTLSESRQNLSYWTSAIMYNCLYGGDDYDALYEQAVKALTPEMVRDAAKALIDSGNFIELVMRPEEVAAE